MFQCEGCGKRLVGTSESVNTGAPKDRIHTLWIFNGKIWQVVCDECYQNEDETVKRIEAKFAAAGGAGRRKVKSKR